MKVKVVYYSKTGSTRKVAEAIAEAVGVRAEKAEDCRIAEKLDVLFVGGAVYAVHEGFHPSLKKLLAGADAKNARRVALFGTYASEASIDKLVALAKDAGLPVAAESFSCKGRFLVMNFTRPNKNDLRQAGEFARRMAG